MFMVQVEMMILPLSFWSEEELKDIPSEEIWCEIADCMFFGNTNDYLYRMKAELESRGE